jgi:hypothetical protein
MNFCPKCGRERQIQAGTGLGVKFCDQCGNKFDQDAATRVPEVAETVVSRTNQKNDRSPSKPAPTRKTKATGKASSSAGSETLESWSSLSPSEGTSGWFPDPLKNSRLRFWNGVEWTDEVANVVSSSLGGNEKSRDIDEPQEDVEPPKSVIKRHVLLEGLGYGNDFVQGKSCYNCGAENLEEAKYCERCGVET